MNPADIGRDTLIGMPAGAIILFYALAAVALAACAAGFFRLWRKYRRGRTATRSRPAPRQIARRLARAVASLTVVRDDPVTGFAHAVAFTGFILLFAGTLIVLVDRDILRFLLPSLVFWEGDFYLGFSLVMDVAGLLLLSALLWLMLRRGLLRPRQMASEHAWRPEDKRTRLRVEDWGFPALLILIVLSGLLLEALRLVGDRPAFESWSPVGWWGAERLEIAGLDAATATAWYPVAWWGHSIASLAFVAFLPFSKAVHMILGAFSVAWQDESLVRSLPEPAGDGTEGYSRIEDFTWHELLSMDACIRCGRCHALCPSAQAGYPLSPRDFILDLRHSLHTNGKAANNGAGPPPLAGGVIPATTIWSCITCAQCVEHCPVGLSHIPILVQLRRTLMLEGQVDEHLQQTLIHLQRNGNAMGQSDRQRARWTQELPFPVRDARKEDVEFLWFVGDNASFDPRAREATRAAAMLFEMAKLDFGILYDAERNAGNDVRRLGEEGLYELLAERNHQALSKARFRSIVTGDPHSYNTLRNEYGLDPSIRILHTSELLLALVEDGRLPRVLGGDRVVTYHDPCYLARYNGVWEAPRLLLQAAGFRVIEMQRNRRDAWCCGAGGGRMWMEDIPCRGERPAEQRLREAAALPGVETLVTACPKDLVMFADALKTTGLESGFAVVDIADLVLHSIGDLAPVTSQKEY